MRTALIAAILLVGSAGLADFQCRGSNTRTHAHVSGWCSFGRFDGRDWQTSNWVTGWCSEGGHLDARDVVTNDWVTGWCDDDPFNDDPYMALSNTDGEAQN